MSRTNTQMTTLTHIYEVVSPCIISLIVALVVDHLDQDLELQVEFMRKIKLRIDRGSSLNQKMFGLKTSCICLPSWYPFCSNTPLIGCEVSKQAASYWKRSLKGIHGVVSWSHNLKDCTKDLLWKNIQTS